MERPPAPGPPPDPNARTEVAPTPPGVVRDPALPREPARVVREPLTEEHLDGMRGWLAEIDRNLRIRTAIGLILVASCIGAAAAAIWLALDEDEGNAASAAAVNRLNERVESLEVRLAEAREQAAEAKAAARAAQVEARNTRSEIAELATAIAELEAADRSGAAGGAGGGNTRGGSGASGRGD